MCLLCGNYVYESFYKPLCMRYFLYIVWYSLHLCLSLCFEHNYSQYYQIIFQLWRRNILPLQN